MPTFFEDEKSALAADVDTIDLVRVAPDDIADRLDEFATQTGQSVASAKLTLARYKAALNSAHSRAPVLTAALQELEGFEGVIVLPRINSSARFFNPTVVADGSPQTVRGITASFSPTFFLPTVSSTQSGYLGGGVSGTSPINGQEYQLGNSLAVTANVTTGKSITRVDWYIDNVPYRDNDLLAPYTLRANGAAFTFGADFAGQGSYTGSSFNLSTGSHSIKATVVHTDATTFDITASFTVVQGGTGPIGGGGYTWTTNDPTPVTLVIPSGYPNPTTVGPNSLNTSQGWTIISSPGVYSNINFTSGVRITSQGVTLRNCRIRRPGGGTCVVEIQNGTSGVTPSSVVLEDCEIIGDNQGFVVGWTDNGHGFTLRRCNIYNAVDGVKAAGNVLIEGCFIHSLRKNPGDHNDCIQDSGNGSNVTIRNNTILGPYQTSTSCVIAQTNVGPINNLQIYGNFFFGGSYSVYMKDKGKGNGPPTNSALYNNVFCADTQGAGPWTVEPNVTVSGNTIYADWAG